MRFQPASTARRLSWSRWLVLALMSLCLPLQGVLAVTMQMSMAAGGVQNVSVMPRAPEASHTEHAAPATGHAAQRHMNHMAAESHGSHESHVGHEGHQGHGDHQGHDMHATAAPGHLAQTSFQDAPHNAGHATGHDTGHENHHGCSFCAQCCIGAALPVAPLTVAGASPTQAHPVTAPVAVLERQPQALDRPPKSLLA